MKLLIRPYYFVIFCAVLGLEILIACKLHDRLIRPYGGDALAVVLVYAGLCSVRTAGFPRMLWLALALGIAFAVELSQLLQLVTRLGWTEHTLLRTVLGTRFDGGDLLAYCVGATAIWVVEERRCSRASASRAG